MYLKEVDEIYVTDHGDWYRTLYGPSVDANILEAADLAGYRRDPVFIRNSKHVPLEKEAILDCMPALFERLREETHPAAYRDGKHL